LMVRNTRKEAEARALLQTKLEMDKIAKIRRLAEEERRRQEEARLERERIRNVQEIARETAQVRARERIMQYRFELEAKHRLMVRNTRKEAEARALLQTKLEMDKIAKIRRLEEEARRRQEEARLERERIRIAQEKEVAEKVRQAEERKLNELKEEIRMKKRMAATAPPTTKADLVQRAMAVQQYLKHSDSSSLEARHSFVIRAAMHLIAAWLPLFAAYYGK